MKFSTLLVAATAATLVSASASAGQGQSHPGGVGLAQGAGALIARSPISHSGNASHLKKRSTSAAADKKSKVKRQSGQCKPKAKPQPQPQPQAPAPAPAPAPAAPQKEVPAPTPPKEEPKKEEPKKEEPKWEEPKKEEPKPIDQEKPVENQTPQPEPQQHNVIGDANARLGQISAFQGENTNAILSWFYTNNPGDSTNGESWCQTRYQNDWPCFAPSLKAMMSNFNYDYNAAAKAYCGREAEITYNGRTTKAFICDAFDDRWVRTPSSLDLTVGLFKTVYGSFDGNKNTVGKGATWRLTGGVVDQGTFKKGKVYKNWKA